MGFVEELSRLIQNWLKADPARDIALLSRSSKVGYGTVRYAYKMECETSIESVVPLLEIICDDNLTVADSFMERHFPVYSRSFKRIAQAGQQTSQMHPTELEPRPVFDQAETEALVKLLLSLKLPMKNLKSAIGEERAVSLLRWLNQEGLVELQDNHIVLTADPVVIKDDSLHCAIGRYIANSTHPKAKGHLSKHLIKMVNLETAKLIWTRLNDTMNYVRAQALDPNNSGTTPVAALVLMTKPDTRESNEVEK